MNSKRKAEDEYSFLSVPKRFKRKVEEFIDQLEQLEKYVYMHGFNLD